MKACDTQEFQESYLYKLPLRVKFHIQANGKLLIRETKIGEWLASK